MNIQERVKILLVEDDEDDFIIVRSLICEMKGQAHDLEWAKTYAEGLERMVRNEHDLCLVDYRLGAQNGVELLRAAMAQGCQSPIILLTGIGEHRVDLEAMEAGAADYLVKGRLDSNSLERTIRYAIQRRRAAAIAASEQARLAAFGAEVGLALTRRDPLDSILQSCARAMVQYLNAALAQISIFDVEKARFERKASAGEIANLDNPSDSIKELESVQIGLRKPIVIKDLRHDNRVCDSSKIQDYRLVAFAAYPLVLEDKLVGYMSVFTRHALTDQIIQEMSSVANGISSCIERKRSQQALDASEIKYRTVVESIQEVIFQLDASGNWIFLNPAWKAVTGRSVEEALGTVFLDYIHPEDREQNSHTFLQLLEGRLDFCRYETRFLRKDGTIRWVEAYLQPTSAGEEPSIVGVSGTLADITERKLAETQIQKLAAFPRVNPNPVLEFAADGTLSYANDAALEMVKVLGKDKLHDILPATAEVIARDCLMTGQKRLREELHINGRTIIWSFFPVVSSHVVHCYGADVTDVMNLEAQFRHAQRLESVGQLAAGVAHDFNNLLTVILGYADALLMRRAADTYTMKALKQISDASRRAATLTRQLLTFSRKQVMQPKIVDLNALVSNLTPMLGRLLGEDVVLKADYLSDLPRMEADVGMIEQIVMNLAVNARDAMPKGGQLLIATSKVKIQPNQTGQHADARAGDFVGLIVTDTGTGMDAATLERIFEPFFSTKEVGRGTGLGLATVYGIVKQHNGWIQVRSEVGSGTTFTIYFPALAGVFEDIENNGSDTVPVQGGRETILLVEDEPDVREFVSEVLRDYRYNVIQAGSGPSAIKAWEEHEGRIDLLLTDMVMPEGMTGRDLAQRLRAQKPELKVIYSSGYSSHNRKEVGESETAFLPKPYHPPQLAQMVRQCLDGTEHTRK